MAALDKADEVKCEVIALVFWTALWNMQLDRCVEEGAVSRKEDAARPTRPSFLAASNGASQVA